MHSRLIGQIMIARGLLNQEQVDHLLDHQTRDHRPFGQLAQGMYGVPEEAVCACLASQIIPECPRVKLCQEPSEPELLELLSPSEAWEHLVLPLRETEAGLVCATTREALPGAIALLQRRTNMPFRFVLADLHLLEQFIAERYDFEGIDLDAYAA